MTARRWAGLALLVLALHLLLLGGMRDALRTLDRTAPPSRPMVPVQVRAVMPAVAPPRAETAPSRDEPPPRPSLATAAVAQPAAERSEVTFSQPIAAPPVPPATVVTAPLAVAGEVPTYRTQLPPAFSFGYDLRRGAQTGQAELHWHPRAEQYHARLAATGPAGPLLAWESVGGFDAAGLAPGRYTDHRQGRGTQAANFQRDAAKVTFSGPSVEHALPPGAQDRLSWMLQLAAIAAADPSLVGPGGQVTLLVVGARGDADVWTFGHAGNESLALPDGGATATVRLLREPRRAYDTRAEVWLDPARHYLPVRARLSHGPADEGLQLLLREELPSP